MPKSEHELQRELDLARGRGGAGDDPCRGVDGAPREHNRVRFRKVRVIENVESLRSKLQSPPLIDADLFDQRGVEGGQARPDDGPARHVPESPVGRRHERFRVKPFVRPSRNHRPAEGRVLGLSANDFLQAKSRQIVRPRRLHDCRSAKSGFGVGFQHSAFAAGGTVAEAGGAGWLMRRAARWLRGSG